MTIESLQFIEDHNRKQTNKGTAKALTFAFLISGSVIFCQLIASFLIGIITVFIPNLNVDSIYVTLALYLFYIGIPALFGFFIFKSTTNTKKYVFVKRRSPKKPLVFIFGAIGSGFIFNLLVSLLFPSVVEHSEDIGIAASSNSEILLNFLMYAILPAILEEILFRGIILKNLLPYSKSGAIIISALLFGITHMNPIQILFASVFGVILGVCYEYTGSLLIPIIMHFINNSISVAVSLAHPQSLIEIIMALIIYVFMGFAIYAIIYYSKNGYKTHSISRLDKPSNGYQLSATRFLFKSVFNIGFVVYAALLIYILVLINMS